MVLLVNIPNDNLTFQEKLDAYSLLSIFNTLSSKCNLIEVKSLIVQHVTLPFIPIHKSNRFSKSWKQKEVTEGLIF